VRLAKRRFACASISSTSTSASSFILIHPTIWPQYTNITDRTGQTGRRSDSIGQTVLQTVAQKLKPGLDASYDIRPGNGEGLFLFRHFINMSLTYLLTYLPTYLQPWDPHGAPSQTRRPSFLKATVGLLEMFNCN